MMKKIITDTKTLATLLMAGAALAACSGDDNIVEEQPANPAQHTYTMTIEATKGGDAATTRALALDGKTLNATWQTTDEVAVYNHTKSPAFTGSLKPKSSGASATLTGSLTGSVAVNDIIYLLWPSVNANYTGQDGTLETIAQRYDYTKGVAKVTSVVGTTIGAEDSSHSGDPVLFTNSQAIVKFTLIDKANDAPINATQLTIDAKDSQGSSLIQSLTYPNAYTLGPITINRTTPTDNVVYAALPFSSQAHFTFALTATDGTHNYTYEKADVTMLNGRYYEVKVKMTRATYPIALSEVTSDYIGSVVTTDGTVYATVAAASAASKTAAGMIAYVSGIGQGLAIALADESGTMNWSTAKSTCEGKTAVTGGTWRLPSAKDWQYMFIGCGSGESYSDPTEEMKRSYSGLASKLTTAGGTALQVGEDYNYWSSSEYDISEFAWSLRFVDNNDNDDNDDNDAIFLFGRKDLNAFVRACLAFGYARGHALASSAVGEIVGSDGLAYAAADKDNLPLGVTAVAMVAYKSATAGESLAIQLNGSPVSKKWADAKTYAEGLTAVPGGTWRLPSKDDWQNMFLGCSVSGDVTSARDYMNPINGFKAKIAATGITWQWVHYWTGREYGGVAWYVYVHLEVSNAVADFNGYGTTHEYNVLGCLAF